MAEDLIQRTFVILLLTVPRLLSGNLQATVRSMDTSFALLH